MCIYICNSKTAEYQEALRLQIEEKRIKKEKEQRLLEIEKQKELDAYLKNHYRGAVPPGAAARRDPNQTRDKNSLDIHNENSRRPPPHMKLPARKHVDDVSEGDVSEEDFDHHRKAAPPRGLGGNKQYPKDKKSSYSGDEYDSRDERYECFFFFFFFFQISTA